MGVLLDQTTPGGYGSNMTCLISCPLGFVSVEHRDGVVVGCEVLPKETSPAVVCVDASHEMCRAIERYFLQRQIHYSREFS